MLRSGDAAWPPPLGRRRPPPASLQRGWRRWATRRWPVGPKASFLRECFAADPASAPPPPPHTRAWAVSTGPRQRKIPCQTRAARAWSICSNGSQAPAILPLVSLPVRCPTQMDCINHNVWHPLTETKVFQYFYPNTYTNPTPYPYSTPARRDERSPKNTKEPGQRDGREGRGTR